MARGPAGIRGLDGDAKQITPICVKGDLARGVDVAAGDGGDATRRSGDQSIVENREPADVVVWKTLGDTDPAPGSGVAQ